VGGENDEFRVVQVEFQKHIEYKNRDAQGIVDSLAWR
jgi:hypothetical protein